MAPHAPFGSLPPTGGRNRPCPAGIPFGQGGPVGG